MSRSGQVPCDLDRKGIVLHAAEAFDTKKLSAVRVLLLACRKVGTLGFCLRLPRRAGAPSSWSESEALMRLCYRERMAEGGQSRYSCLISDVIDLVVTPCVYARGKEVSTGVLPSRQSRGKVLK